MHFNSSSLQSIYNPRIPRLLSHNISHITYLSPSGGFKIIDERHSNSAYLFLISNVVENGLMLNFLTSTCISSTLFFKYNVISHCFYFLLSSVFFWLDEQYVICYVKKIRAQFLCCRLTEMNNYQYVVEKSLRLNFFPSTCIPSTLFFISRGCNSSCKSKLNLFLASEGKVFYLGNTFHQSIWLKYLAVSPSTVVTRLLASSDQF
jgi:hypothetical protein